MFIPGEIKMVMVFLPGVASACPTGIARGLLLLTANRQDLAWEQSEPVTPPVAWRRQVGCQAAQAVDSRLRPADRDFAIRDLRLT